MQTGSENDFFFCFSSFSKFAPFFQSVSRNVEHIFDMNTIFSKWNAHSFVCVYVYKKWDMVMFKIIQQFKNQKFSMKSSIFMLSMFSKVMISTANAKDDEKPFKIHFNFFYLCIKYVQSSYRSVDFYGEPGEMLFEKHSEEVFIHFQPKTECPNHLSWVMVSFCRFFCLTFYMLLLKWIQEKKAK